VSGPYGVILADPPWRYEAGTTNAARTIERHYETMAHDELCALPVAGMAATDAVLFLWATNPKLEEALALMRSWGFRYRTAAVWVKPHMGMGYYVRAQHEPLLIGICGRPKVPRPGVRPRSVIFAKRRRHSEKPPEVHELIERMYPDARRLELFARRPRDGWDVWGNESAPVPFAMEMQA